MFSSSAVVEAPPGEDAFGHVEVFADRAQLHGTGRIASREMIFPGKRGGNGSGSERSLKTDLHKHKR